MSKRLKKIQIHKHKEEEATCERDTVFGRRKDLKMKESAKYKCLETIVPRRRQASLRSRTGSRIGGSTSSRRQ